MHSRAVQRRRGIDVLGPIHLEKKSMRRRDYLCETVLLHDEAGLMISIDSDIKNNIHIDLHTEPREDASSQAVPESLARLCSDLANAS